MRKFPLKIAYRLHDERKTFDDVVAGEYGVPSGSRWVSHHIAFRTPFLRELVPHHGGGVLEGVHVRYAQLGEEDNLKSRNVNEIEVWTLRLKARSSQSTQRPYWSGHC